MIVAGRPRQSSPNVARGRGHKMTTLIDKPYRNPPSAQTSNHTERSLVRAHYKGTAGTGRDRQFMRRCIDPVWNCDGGRHGSMNYDSNYPFLRIPRVIAREANSAPATNRMSGPKLQAAGAPRK